MARPHFTPPTTLDPAGWGPTVLKPKLDEHDVALDALEKAAVLSFTTLTAAQSAGAAGQLAVGQLVVIG